MRTTGVRRWDVLLLVAAGGSLGSLARWGLATALDPAADPGQGSVIPWATLVANLVGSFALGVLMGLAERDRIRSPYLLPFLGVGVLGGFTTYSTYALEVRALAGDGDVLLAASYLVGTVIGALLAVTLGLALARRRSG